MDLIERIRKDIEGRLEAILSEADKLRKALAALAPGTSAPPGPSRPAPRARTIRPATRASRPATPRRTAPGATKRRVLQALSDGNARTAGEVAAATGIKRGTVSTTLSKLAKAGEVVKADRGYRLPSQSWA
jgi:DNA-binding transcriptional ArsR family regulator